MKIENIIVENGRKCGINLTLLAKIVSFSFFWLCILGAYFVASIQKITAQQNCLRHSIFP